MDTERPPVLSSAAVAVGAALEAGLRSATKAAQVDEAIKGMSAMAQAAERLQLRNPEALKGDLFEYIEAAKFNAEAVASAPSLSATLTREVGSPHAPADILVHRHGEVIRQVQAKALRETEGLTRELSDPKYQGMQKLVPVDKTDQVRARAEFRQRYWDERGDHTRAEQNLDTAENVTGELHAGDVSSGGTTAQELDFATRHPGLYRLRVEARYVAGEVCAAGGRSLAVGALVGGAISAVKHGVGVARGEITGKDAVIAVAKDAARNGVRSGGTGAAGALVRAGAKRVGAEALSKANVAVAVAGGAIDIGVTLHDYARGRVTGLLAAERIGQTGCCTMSSIYAGAAAGLIFGPVGAAVGSLAAYLVAAQVYQSSIAISRRAQLAEEEAARIEAVCADAIEAMSSLRHEMEGRVAEITGARQHELERCLAAVDAGLDDDSASAAVEGLSKLAVFYGHTLQLATFEEFDEFMLGEKPLVI